MSSGQRRQLGREQLLAAERWRLSVNPHGLLRIAIGYPNSYHVAMSSLAFQWVTELAAGLGEVGVQRCVAGPPFTGRTLDCNTPLAELDMIAWTCSFEPDAVLLLQALDAAGMPRTAAQRRRGRYPLIVVGGPLATINPLPLAPAVDLFCLGPAEQLLPELTAALLETSDRDRLLEDLAGRDGFFVPRHHLDAAGMPLKRLRRLPRRGADQVRAAAIPAAHCVTPHTEYAERALVEISRGCPQHCRFCWIGHTSGRLHAHPLDALEERIAELTALSRRIGLVATAVGDHPQMASILDSCRRQGLEVAVSSLRIQALTSQVLRPLAGCGANSITIAPEAGTDRLRAALGKPIGNDRILDGIATAQACGIEGLKMYFLVGVPGEEEQDLVGIAELIRAASQVLRRHGRSRGRLRTLRAGFNLLVPKPYTPLHRAGMLDVVEARRRLRLIRGALRHVDNLRLDLPSLREARWQGFLSRAGTAAFDLVAEAAAGMPLARLLADHDELVAGVVSGQAEGPVPWHFIASAPDRKRSCD